MTSYDPSHPPRPPDWLMTDEAERLELVSAFHRRQTIRLPNLQLHSVIHVVVENQLALGEEIVVNALARLQREGLDRHEALHAIGSVLAEDLYALMKEGDGSTDEPYRRYLDRLERLTADSWRAG